MGHYKNLFTPWESIGSYEDDELKEMDKMEFRNGVLMPNNPGVRYETRTSTSAIGEKVPCFYCGKVTYYRPNRPNQECRDCRRKAQLAYIKAYSK